MRQPIQSSSFTKCSVLSSTATKELIRLARSFSFDSFLQTHSGFSIWSIHLLLVNAVVSFWCDHIYQIFSIWLARLLLGNVILSFWCDHIFPSSFWMTRTKKKQPFCIPIWPRQWLNDWSGYTYIRLDINPIWEHKLLYHRSNLIYITQLFFIISDMWLSSHDSFFITHT